MRTILISLLLTCLATVACQRIETAPLPQGPLKLEVQAEGMEAIPSSYGDLIAVTQLPEQPFTQVLWFQREDKSLVGVRVNVARGTLPLVLSIPRR